MSAPSNLEIYDLVTPRGAVIVGSGVSLACAAGLSVAAALAYLLLTDDDARVQAVARLRWAVDLYGAAGILAVLWLLMGVVA